jgi:hypothetical protein
MAQIGSLLGSDASGTVELVVARAELLLHRHQLLQYRPGGPKAEVKGDRPGSARTPGSLASYMVAHDLYRRAALAAEIVEHECPVEAPA